LTASGVSHITTGNFAQSADTVNNKNIDFNCKNRRKKIYFKN